MKKHYIIVSAVLFAAALLVSCQNNEFNEDVYVPEKGEIVFRLTGNAKATKAADENVTVKGMKIDLGNINGTNFFLEETITRLDDVTYGPETKGVPGYTENFHSLYGGFTATVYRKGESAAYETDGSFTIVNEEKLIYKRKYPNDLWEKEGLYFFLRTGDQTGVGTPSYNITSGTISFHYDGSSLTTAEAQNDILFTSRAVTNEDEYNKLIDKDNGIPVFFHHVLAGVKFAIGNSDADISKGIAINSVVIKGLYDSGDCVVTPLKENDSYTNKDGVYSSATQSVWAASGLAASNASKTTGFSSGDYGTPIDFDEGPFADSFYSAGNEKNLNKSDASQTFWFIPQALARTSSETPVTLTINYNTSTETDLSWDLNLSDILSSITWNAGELRTYTIKIDDVNIKVEDTVTMGTNDAIVGASKEAVTVTNTGNTDVFIRAAIVGQWLDKNNNPVFGFTDNVNFLYEVDSWYEDQFVKTTAGTHGKFYDLAGYKNGTNPVNGWYYNSDDGYYYYTTPVPPEGVTNELFSKYEILRIPHTTNAGEALSKDMYFVLEIATQAISARTSNGTLLDGEDAYIAAWANAKSIDEEE
ncbi:MAG: hypothetical protein J5374_10415 [Bacteroidales bacterium]|nr:hypothetical protein [Bacteroidales bacterium]